MAFFLASVSKDGSSEPLSDYGIYETGSEASRVAKRLMETGLYYKVQPRRTNDAETNGWRTLEQAKFDTDKHPKFPENWNLIPIVDHFAYPYEHAENDWRISYFARPEDGIINKRTTKRLSRYIPEFYPHLKDLEVKTYVAMIDDGGVLHFATTPDEIEFVYTNGPSSCMSHAKEHWKQNNCSDHPVRIYGAGDLAVAYLKKSGKNGRISGRAICWPERKQYGRIYGDGERMVAALRDAGFTQVNLFIGARLLRIPNTSRRVPPGKDPCFVISPYFDNIAAAVQGDDSVYVTIRDRNDDEVKSGRKVMLSGGTNGYVVETRWCPRMRSTVTGDFIKVEGEEKEWSKLAVDNGYVFWCPKTELFYPSEKAVSVRVGRRNVMWSQNAVDKFAAKCTYTGLILPVEQMTKATDGAMIAQGAVSEYEELLSRKAEAKADPSRDTLGRFARRKPSSDANDVNIGA